MFFYKRIFKGDARTVKAKKNILASVFLKGVDSLVYLLLVPVTLGYLNPYEYGIWLTLNSILMWINSFDIGLGNGLRNKLAQAIALNDKNLGRIYVSTTFIMLIIIMGLLFILGLIIEPYLNWYDILGTSTKVVPKLDQIVFLTFSIFCLNFIFKFIGNVYLALQLPAINNLLVISGHIIALIVIYLLTHCTRGSLLYVALTYSSSPLIVYICAYPITFFKIYPYLKPSLKWFRLGEIKELINISFKFFFLQISSIILFCTSNLVISHMFGPEEVTPYNISYRYFSIVSIIMVQFISPMWSATTDAHAKGDFKWIKQSMSKIIKLNFLCWLFLALMLSISPLIYKIWIGNEVDIPFVMSILLAIYIAILILSTSYSYFLNGLGKLQLQTWNTLIEAILFIPLCLILGHFIKIYGIIIAMISVNLSGLILNIIQFNKIINTKAKGIWNK